MLVTILIQKIISLFLVMLMGAALVRTKLLKKDDSKAMSAIALYLIVPCVIVNAFQVDVTADIMEGLLLSVVSAILIHVLLLLLNLPLRKLLHLDVLEQVSMIYSNAGNLIIPLITAMLGEEMIIYCTGFMAVQLVLLWTHCKCTICGDKKLEWKKILTNINMIAIYVSFFLLVTGIRLSGPLADAISSIGSMIGPLCMLITGMLIGSADLKKVVLNKRLWMTCGIRLLLVPLLVLAMLKLLRLETLIPNGSSIILISYMACITPSASTIVQMAQVYGQDAEYASSINVLTTLLSIVTMPLMVYLFTLIRL